VGRGKEGGVGGPPPPPGGREGGGGSVERIGRGVRSGL